MFPFYVQQKQEETFFITIEKIPLTVNMKLISQSTGISFGVDKEH